MRTFLPGIDCIHSNKSGLGLGPLLVGPLSELYGRSIIYRLSFVSFFAVTWATAFPPHIGICGPILYP